MTEKSDGLRLPKWVSLEAIGNALERLRSAFSSNKEESEFKIDPEKNVLLESWQTIFDDLEKEKKLDRIVPDGETRSTVREILTILDTKLSSTSKSRYDYKLKIGLRPSFAIRLICKEVQAGNLKLIEGKLRHHGLPINSFSVLHDLFEFQQKNDIEKVVGKGRLNVNDERLAGFDRDVVFNIAVARGVYGDLDKNLANKVSIALFLINSLDEHTGDLRNSNLFESLVHDFQGTDYGVQMQSLGSDVENVKLRIPEGKNISLRGYIELVLDAQKLYEHQSSRAQVDNQAQGNTSDILNGTRIPGWIEGIKNLEWKRIAGELAVNGALPIALFALNPTLGAAWMTFGMGVRYGRKVVESFGKEKGIKKVLSPLAPIVENLKFVTTDFGDKNVALENKVARSAGIVAGVVAVGIGAFINNHPGLIWTDKVLTTGLKLFVAAGAGEFLRVGLSRFKKSDQVLISEGFRAAGMVTGSVAMLGLARVGWDMSQSMQGELEGALEVDTTGKYIGGLPTETSTHTPTAVVTQTETPFSAATATVSQTETQVLVDQTQLLMKEEFLEGMSEKGSVTQDFMRGDELVKVVTAGGVTAVFDKDGYTFIPAENFAEEYPDLVPKITTVDIASSTTSQSDIAERVNTSKDFVTDWKVQIGEKDVNVHAQEQADGNYKVYVDNKPLDGSFSKEDLVGGKLSAVDLDKLVYDGKFESDDSRNTEYEVVDGRGGMAHVELVYDKGFDEISGTTDDIVFVYRDGRLDDVYDSTYFKEEVEPGYNIVSTTHDHTGPEVVVTPESEAGPSEGESMHLAYGPRGGIVGMIQEELKDSNPNMTEKDIAFEAYRMWLDLRETMQQNNISFTGITGYDTSSLKALLESYKLPEVEVINFMKKFN